MNSLSICDCITSLLYGRSEVKAVKAADPHCIGQRTLGGTRDWPGWRDGLVFLMADVACVGSIDMYGLDLMDIEVGC